jgi:hypothetical protein
VDASAVDWRAAKPTTTVKAIFAKNDVVFGIWQDAERPFGVGWLILKGAALIPDIEVSRESGALRMSAIPCGSHERAIATKRVLGQILNVY